MRILVATDQWFPDYRGGSARIATATSERLAEAGHDVTVIAPAFKGSPRIDTRGRRRLLRVIPRNAFPRTLLEAPGTWRAAHRLRGRFELVIGHHPSESAGLAAAFPATPLVHVFHASPSREARLSRLAARPVRRIATAPLAPILGALERRAVRRADRIFVLSDYSASLVLHDHGRAAADITRVLPGGIDVDVFQPADGPEAARTRLGLAHSAKIVVAVRRLDAGLGLEQLFAAIELLDDRSVLLALIGQGPLEVQLRARAATLRDRVQFIGGAEDSKLAEWYRAANAFVLPPAPHEGFGLATAEALACGTPAAGSSMGATPELLRPLDERLVAASPDPAGLAQAIAAALELSTSPDFRKRCREYALSRFSWGAVFSSWERELEAVALQFDDKSQCLH
jgi:glycosyltransferase involved in cell wall biosynthesis